MSKRTTIGVVDGMAWFEDGTSVDSMTVELIAAAPDLLAVLKRTLSMAVGHAADARGVSPSECKDFPWAVEAQAVIDRATKEEA